MASWSLVSAIAAISMITRIGTSTGIDMATYEVTPQLYNSIKSDITAMLHQFNMTDPETGAQKYRVLPTVVRFGFHSCVGGCNGCINLNDNNNYGLQRAMSPLEFVYKPYASQVTRADFWSFAMIAASEMAANQGRSPYIPTFTPEYGRLDCPTAPQTCAKYEFPLADMDTKQVLEYYLRTMNLSPREVVALLGGHTLSGGHRWDSGYFNDWGKQPNRLDHGYYRDMIDPTFGWRMASTNTQWFRPNQFQWVHQNGTFMMLNVDMALYKDISPVGRMGYVACEWQNCPLSSTAAYVEMYAKDNKLFLDDYAKVVTKMLRTGQSGLKPVLSGL